MYENEQIWSNQILIQLGFIIINGISTSQFNQYIKYLKQLFEDMKGVFTIITLIFTLLIDSLIYGQYAVTKKQAGNSTLKLSLQYTGKLDYYIKEKSKIVKNLIFEVASYTYVQFAIKIYDSDKKRFQVPQGGIFPSDPVSNYTYPFEYADMKLSYTQNPFTFKITRGINKVVVFDSSASQLIFSQYYIQIGTYTTSRTIYGFSQRFSKNFKLKPGKWTVFPRDRGQQMDYGYGKQTHGYYPVYIQRDPTKRFFLNYFRTSNALDVIVDEYQNDRYKLTYKTIGGIIDFRFFLGMVKAQNIANLFYNYLGKTAVPPFWSLGFHQCRWGYKNISALENVLAQYKKYGIPLDTIWTDIDYMKDYQTFTIDQQRFPLDRMAKITSQYKYIPIIQPSIRLGKGYAYEEGKKRNVFIKDAQGNDQIGKVWAGEVVFTDYFHPNATDYWIAMLQSLYNKVKFSGVWLDMNQISNLCNGPCRTPTKQGIDYTNDIPYHPGNDTIETQAIPLNATHYGGLSQSDVHTFFGFMETYATYFFLYNKGMPFIITRSNTLGTNKFGFHWTGDNYANYQFLRTSISSNLMFSFWGIHMVGSDICGFGGNATDQLCARWFQLGSLYPFLRNHNEIQAIDQQPYALGQLTLKSSINNLKLRYSLLKQFYSQYVTKRGKPYLFKPLFYQFQDDQEVFKDQIQQTQFLVTNCLMSAPVVEENKTSREVYFPMPGLNWYDFHTYKRYEGGNRYNISNSPSDKVPLFIRQFYFVMTQNVQNVTKTTHLGNNFRLFGALTYNKIRSNSTYKLYEAYGGILAIKNYSNETLIQQQCLTAGCSYQLRIELEVYPQSKLRNLTIGSHSVGNKQIIEQIVIDQLTLLTVDGEISRKMAQPILINVKTTVLTIDISDANQLQVETQ